MTIILHTFCPDFLFSFFLICACFLIISARLSFPFTPKAHMYWPNYKTAILQFVRVKKDAHFRTFSFPSLPGGWIMFLLLPLFVSLFLIFKYKK